MGCVQYGGADSNTTIVSINRHSDTCANIYTNNSNTTIVSINQVLEKNITMMENNSNTTIVSINHKYGEYY